MNKKYFKIVPANSADAAILYALLTSKTFYPEATSVPPLPPLPVNPAFDYRQFFVVVGFTKEGDAIVYTRAEYTVGEFGTNVIPTAEWTARYKLSIAPTIVALPTFSNTALDGHNFNTNLNAFLSYDYQLVNNK
jgi:hypothetical protein